MKTVLKLLLFSWFGVVALISASQSRYNFKIDKVYAISEDSAKCLVVLTLEKKKFPFDSVAGKIALVTYIDSIEETISTLAGKHVKVRKKLLGNMEMLKKENIRYCMTQSPYFTDFNFGPKGFDFASLIPYGKKAEDGNFMLKARCAVGKKRLKTGKLPKGRYMMVAVSESRKAYAYIQFEKWR